MSNRAGRCQNPPISTGAIPQKAFSNTTHLSRKYGVSAANLALPADFIFFPTLAPFPDAVFVEVEASSANGVFRSREAF
jgi:hypothetical protein